jgi:hypothetical protein
VPKVSGLTRAGFTAQDGQAAATRVQLTDKLLMPFCEIFAVVENEIVGALPGPANLEKALVWFAVSDS